MSDPLNPLAVFERSLQQAAELLYEAAGLKPTHGGLLPKGIGYAAPTYFLPQPIGFADPAAFGLHHDFLFGITYDRAALQFSDPEHLDRQLAAAREAPHAPVRPRQIRGRADVGLFDYPFILGSGQLDYLSPEGPRPSGPPAEVSDLLQQAASYLVRSGFIEFSVPPARPSVTQSVSELRAANFAAVTDLIEAGRALDVEQQRIQAALLASGAAPAGNVFSDPLPAALLASGAGPGGEVYGTWPLSSNALQQEANRRAPPPLRDLITERADP